MVTVNLPKTLLFILAAGCKPECIIRPEKESSDEDSNLWSTDEGEISTQMDPVAGDGVPYSACIAGEKLHTEKFNSMKVQDSEDVSLQLPTKMQANAEDDRATLQLLSISESVTSEDSTLQLLSPTKQPMWPMFSQETIQ